MTRTMIPSPTGATRIYATLGYPIAQVKSPEVLNAIFAAESVNAVMLPIEVHPNDLASTLVGLKKIRNLDGILITIPHKCTVVPYIDLQHKAVEVLGAANVLRREANGLWTGDNFDGRGFVNGLKKQGHEVSGRSIVIVGGGGAGSSIAMALLESGAGHIQLVDLDIQKVSNLASRLLQRWPGSIEVANRPCLDHADIIVNATPLGLRNEDPLPFEPGELPQQILIADIIMTPAETRLLKQATAAGHATHAGIHMLDEQISLYREFFGF